MNSLAINRRNYRQFSALLLLFLTVRCAPNGITSLGELSGTGEVDVPAGSKFAVGPAPDTTLNIGQTRDFVLSITAAKDFEGSVDLTIERDEIDAIDMKGGVLTTLAPAVLILSPGETKQIAVHIETMTTAPSFSNEHFHVVATESGGATAPAQSVNTTKLTVSPVYEIMIIGGPAPENWSAPRTASFASHAAGLLIRYINMDTIAHRVHSGGAIPHGGTDMSPMGGRYEVTVPPGAQTSASFYCHSHEGGAQAKTFQFNVP